MVVVGWGLDIKGYFMVSTMVISFPTSVKIFSWLFSLFVGRKCFSLSLSCFSFFLFFFSIGGVTGLFLSNSTLDTVFHDSYFVVGHFHFVLANASVFGFLSSFSFFFYSLFGYLLCLKSFLIFLSSFSFFLFLLFTPFHFIGLYGLPRRVSSYPFDNFIYFYICNISFIGVWEGFMLFIFCIIRLFSLCIRKSF